MYICGTQFISKSIDYEFLNAKPDMKLGHNLIKTFFDYYKLTGYINLQGSDPSVDPKPSNSSKEIRVSRAASEPICDENRWFACLVN